MFHTNRGDSRSQTWCMSQAEHGDQNSNREQVQVFLQFLHVDSPLLLLPKRSCGSSDSQTVTSRQKPGQSSCPVFLVCSVGFSLSSVFGNGTTVTAWRTPDFRRFMWGSLSSCGRLAIGQRRLP